MGDHGEIESPPLLPNSFSIPQRQRTLSEFARFQSAVATNLLLGVDQLQAGQDPLKEELLMAITKLLRLLPTRD